MGDVQVVSRFPSFFCEDRLAMLNASCVIGAGHCGTWQAVLIGSLQRGQAEPFQYPHLSIHFPMPHCPHVFFTAHIQNNGGTCCKALRVASQLTRLKAWMGRMSFFLGVVSLHGRKWPALPGRRAWVGSDFHSVNEDANAFTIYPIGAVPEGVPLLCFWESV